MAAPTWQSNNVPFADTLLFAADDKTTAGGVSVTGAALRTGLSPSVQVNTVAASGAAQVLAFPSKGGASYSDITLTANCTFAISGGASGFHQVIVALLHQDSTGGRTVTWPNGVLWANGVTPSMGTAAGNILRVEFETFDGGVTILGRY